MTHKALTYDQLAIRLADIYAQMGYHDATPNEVTQKETIAIINEVRGWLRPQFCYLTERKLPDFEIGQIIEKQLKGSEAYVLFICTYDPFLKDKRNGFGLPCYTFKNTCAENPDVSLDDKSNKVIYNAGAYEAVEDEKIRDFLHFVSTNIPEENSFSQTISDTVEKLKADDEFRSDYAAMNLHDRDIKKKAKEEGILEGAQQKAIEDAENCLREGDTPEKVSRCIGLPLEKVLELQKTITVKA